MRSITCAALLALTTAGCGSNLDIQWTADPTEEGASALLVVPNVDDDNGDGEVDWTTPAAVDGEDDYATITLQNGKRASTLYLEGGQDGVRVFHEGRLVLGEGAGASWVLPDRKGGDTITVQVEVQTWGRAGTLALADDKKGEQVRLDVIGSPPTMGHHLLPTQHVYVVGLDFFGLNNDAMISDMERILGDRLTVAPGPEFGDDPWMQDEPEWFSTWSPDSDGYVILDSVRNGNGMGGLDPFPETLAGSGVSVVVHGRPRLASTFDAFGNLEVSPPVTVGGVEYPLGRIYYGWDGVVDNNFEYGPQADVRDFLADIGAQEPFAVDTSWLCVGHIDEYTSFIPDPSAPRGFRFLIADTAVGLATLKERPDDFSTGVHGRRRGMGHGRGTIGAYVNDAALVAYNQDLQRDHIEPALEIFKRELELTDDEIVRVPAFFEEEIDEFGVCGALAVIPGNVNMLVVTDEGGETATAIMPDPFVRPTDAELDEDPFVQAWRDLLPPGVTPEFVDDWDIYHMGAGEVHCATNQERTAALATIDLESWLATEVTR